jgi:hypothetical protein
VLLGKDNDWGFMRANEHANAFFKSRLLARGALKTNFLYQTMKKPNIVWFLTTFALYFLFLISKKSIHYLEKRKS